MDWDWFSIDTAVRVTAPLALELGEFHEPLPARTGFLQEFARQLRILPPIHDRSSARRAREVARDVYNRVGHLPSSATAYGARETASRAAAGGHSESTAEYARRTHEFFAVLATGRAGMFVVHPSLASRIIRYLDLDVHSTAELETALVANDYLLEHPSAGPDDRLRMQMLNEFRPIIKAIGIGWSPPVGLNNLFRKPLWHWLPGGEAAHPSWSTFLSWPSVVVREWLFRIVEVVEGSK